MFRFLREGRLYRRVKSASLLLLARSDNRDFRAQQQQAHGTTGDRSPNAQPLAAYRDSLNRHTTPTRQHSGKSVRRAPADSETRFDGREDRRSLQLGPYPTLRSFSPPTTSANPSSVTSAA